MMAYPRSRYLDRQGNSLAFDSCMRTILDACWCQILTSKGALDAARLLIRTGFRDPARTHGLPMSSGSLGRTLGHAFACFKSAPCEKKRVEGQRGGARPASRFLAMKNRPNVAGCLRFSRAVFRITRDKCGGDQSLRRCPSLAMLALHIVDEKGFGGPQSPGIMTLLGAISRWWDYVSHLPFGGWLPMTAHLERLMYHDD